VVSWVDMFRGRRRWSGEVPGGHYIFGQTLSEAPTEKKLLTFVPDFDSLIKERCSK